MSNLTSPAAAVALPEVLCQRVGAAIATDKLRFAQRLLHGRGGAIAGCEAVTLDSFFPLLTITLFADAPPWLALLAPYFRATLMPYGFTHLALQDRSQARAQWRFLVGQPLEVATTRLAEGPVVNLSFQAQNIGLFNDAAGLRQWLFQHARGRQVLNLFAYTGALSLAALAGGAERVANVDISKGALTRARENHLLNQFGRPRVEYLPLNVLTSAGRIKRAGPFDLIIIDPPTAQPGSFMAERDYPKLARRLPEWLAEKGTVIACLNAPELDRAWLKTTIAAHLPSHRVRSLASAPWVDEANPERGLKVLIFEPVQDSSQT